MIQLTYLSAAKPSLSPDDFDAILAQARSKNAQAGLTGLLLAGSGSFIQVLEGAEEDVNACFARINKDPRHSAVRIMLRAPISARQFGQWSMGYKKLRADKTGPEGSVDARDIDQALPPALAGAVKAFLKSFHAANIA